MTSLPSQSEYDLVERVARSGCGTREGMNELLTACAERIPHPVWQMLRTQDFESDTITVRSWLARLLEQEPVPWHVTGLYFGLAEYAGDDGDGTGCRLHLIGSDNFSAQDEDCQWALVSTYTPRGGLVDSVVLNEIYRQVHLADPEVTSLGGYILGLGYASLLVRNICEELRVQVLSEAAWRGIAVGFQCGDAVVLGRLESAGWSSPSE